jgi:hypothetical protein
MAFPFMALGSTLGQAGDLAEQKARTSLRFDPISGESYSTGTEAFGAGVGATFTPHKFMLDKNYTVGERLMGFVPGGQFIAGKMRSKAEEATRISALGRVKTALEGTPAYQSPEDVAQLKAVTASGAETMRGLGDEMIKVAQSRRQKGVPGQEIRKEQVRQYAQSAVDDFIESGGASMSSLGAIVQARQQQSQNMLALAEQANSQGYAEQQAYMGAILGRAGIEAQAAGVEGVGYQTGISEADKLYQSELEQTRPLQQFAITQYGNRAAQMR